MTPYQAEKAWKNTNIVEPLSNQIITNPTEIIDAFRKCCVELCTSQSIRDQSKVEVKVLPIEASPLEFCNQVKDLLEVLQEAQREPCFSRFCSHDCLEEEESPTGWFLPWTHLPLLVDPDQTGFFTNTLSSCSFFV